MKSRILTATLALASVSSAAHASPVKLTCGGRAFGGRITLASESSGAAVDVTVFDNYWHPAGLTCSKLRDGAVASTCEGDWSFVVGRERYATATALLLRVNPKVPAGIEKDGRTGVEIPKGEPAAYEIVFTSNTSARSISLPCAIAK